MNKKEAIIIILALSVSFILLYLPSDQFDHLLKLLFGVKKTCPLGYGNSTQPLLHFGPSPSSSEPPRTFYINCTVFTSDTDHPYATSFIVQNGKFSFVQHTTNNINTFAQELSQARDIDTIIDLQGAFVTPGLVDSHVHFINGGLSLSRLDLRNINSKQAFIDAVDAAIKNLSPGQWLVGSNWDESNWNGGEPPSRFWIDPISPYNPVFLTRSDAHQGVANSMALKMADIGSETPDPPGGIIYKNNAVPTGLLADAAQHLVSRKIPSLSIENRTSALMAAQRHAVSLGITSVHDMGRVAYLDGEEAAWNDLIDVYKPAADRGLLKVRVRCFVPISMWKHLYEMIVHIGSKHPDGRLSWGGVKEFYDGSIGSRSAYMHEAYTDYVCTTKNADENGDTNSKGLVTVDKDSFRQQIIKADAAGLQIATHAIGDRAVDEVLDAYISISVLNSTKTVSDTSSSTIKKKNDNNNINDKKWSGAKKSRNIHRHRIEHLQHVSDAKKIASLLSCHNIITTPNPLHYVADQSILLSRIGKERMKNAYVFNTLHQHHVVAAYSSDWPVVPLNPLYTLLAASRGTRGEEVSIETALLALTRDAAYAGMQEYSIGSIKKGYFADFVVFERNVIDALSLVKTFQTDGVDMPRVLQTYIQGICEYGCGNSVQGGDREKSKNENKKDEF